MKTKIGNGTAKLVGLVAFWAAILAFWAVAFALGGVLKLDGVGPFGLIVAGVLGALPLGGPFFFVELCKSPPFSARFWANAGRIFGAGFVGTLAAVLGAYWAAPLFFVVWFAVKRKTTALGPTLRRFPGRILTALVASAALCGATGAIFNVDPRVWPAYGYFALLTTLAVFYATAALAFALVAFKAANVDAETTCENVDGGVAEVAEKSRKVGLVAYFAGVLAFAALAFWVREGVADGFWLCLALLWNFPFFCVTFGDRSLWRDWPLSLAVSSALAILSVYCCVLTPPLAGLIAAILFGVWLAAVAKRTFWPWRTAAAVGILAVVETALLFRAAATEEHFWCSLTVGLGIIPLIAFHWCSLGAVAFWLGARRATKLRKTARKRSAAFDESKDAILTETDAG